ncbi:phospholipase C [Chitinophaga sp. YR573]|uniref:phosphocholine-specific phospholipase C n=1 Tax=Chitinophaga sp. YR573 TaxID=1881040 RepID=UPI0008C7C7EF|nr:phospholipase C, phosphocholine-specific [Chitinophaga sp. YR573]SEW17037.1 phospholipase C [Chitinophaga sp. YR573]
MDNRRDFIKKAALLSGGAGLLGVLPASIQKALAIDPAPGSTFLDAEHIVLLMQENRSFDHCYGTLKGVRGFNDPRAITLPNKNLVWLQSNKEGETYAPFRLDLKDSKATWMSSLPHSWENQVDARNDGKYDKWLDSKRSGNKEYADMPLTMGHYTREDIPFYYSLADAFTVCDQNFCSSLTGTTPNRLYFWTGTLRSGAKADGQPNVRNSEVDYGFPANWTTFPERLEDNGISWKVYQNEISVGVGFEGDEDAWLANFTDNPLEWFAQYHVSFSIPHYKDVQKQIAKLSEEIKNSPDEEKQKKLTELKEYAAKWRPEKFAQLSQKERNLHEKAFTTNKKDPAYHSITTLNYKDGDKERTMTVPKGDVLHQFREDVKTGQLPTVSWLVAPENFSDHPGAPWYGAWYVSEVMDILTQDPEVWKKTIFILAYDENDGDFDHIPPFVSPHLPGTGFVSRKINTAAEYVTREQELSKPGMKAADVRESPIGLGYRVPLVIASPWSRGGWVNSQVFDHTSTLQFLEEFLGHKTKKRIVESNISQWRRTVCGDLTSVFRPYNGEKITLPKYLDRDPFIESIHKAQFKNVPSGFRKLTAADIAAINHNPAASPLMPKQEEGISNSCALPYELTVNGHLSGKAFAIEFQVGDTLFKKKSAGAPFNVYAPGKYQSRRDNKMEGVRTWSYAVSAGDELTDKWVLSQFENEKYHLKVYGPNGFFREFKGDKDDPKMEVYCYNEHFTGNLNIEFSSSAMYSIEITDNGYKSGDHSFVIPGKGSIKLDLSQSFGWYDFTVRAKGYTTFEQRFAGRVETGKASFTDPLMGRVKL